MRSPCIDCHDRFPGCQDRCERGREYQAWASRKRDKIRENKTKQQKIDSAKLQAIERIKKLSGTR